MKSILVRSTQFANNSGQSDFWPLGYKTFFMLNSTEHEISPAHKNLSYRQMKKFIALGLSDVVFIMLINVKKLTIVGILTFMSRINFVLSCVQIIWVKAVLIFFHSTTRIILVIISKWVLWQTLKTRMKCHRIWHITQN